MKYQISLVLMLVMRIVKGQVILFNNIYPKAGWDYSNCVIERKDGKYLVAGSSNSRSETDYDVNLLLIDSIGNLIWDKYIGEADTLEFAYSIIETKDSNFVISGRIGNYYAYLQKFDYNGNSIWHQRYISQYNNEGAYSVGETNDGGFYFVRPDYNTSLFKTDSVGNTLWFKEYDFGRCYSVTQTSDGGYIMTGYAQLGPQNSDIILIKTNSNGDTLWTKLYGGDGNDRGLSVIQLPDNGYLIATSLDANLIDQGNVTYIIRTNSIGDTIWTKKLLMGDPHFIQRCKNNNGYVFSYVYNDGWIASSNRLGIAKIDTSGNLEWDRTFDGTTYTVGNNVTQTSDGGFLLTGSTNYNYPNYNSENILIKLDSAGNYVLESKIHELESDKILAVYPNPTSEYLNFKYYSTNDLRIVNIEIFNALGQLIKNQNNLIQDSYKLYVREFRQGLYIYKISTEDKRVLTGKFSVTR